MRRIATAILAVCLILTISSCRFSYMKTEEIYETIENAVENIGMSQLTDDTELIGTRSVENDFYTGSYKSDCEGVTGRDVVFGGASTEGRNLYLHGHIDEQSGEVKIRIRMNWEVTELAPDADGYFETELNLESGGNYVMAVYENFSGSVEMISEYTDDE